ncbi:MAG: class I SAM-dependent methyltransferase [Betaproteobacteria bacterium]|nr:class I SAM-dependent methyltransferase [Betaproteobacteria bacterium]
MMTAFRCPRRLMAALALLLFATGAHAQAQPAQKSYEPQPYQEGKDVIWLPTPQELVDKMLQMAQVGPKDFVIDLGSGDGRTVITAAKKFGARAMGIEYNPEMVEYSTRAAQKEGVAGKVKFMKADLFETDFSAATVVTMYLLSTLNLKLRPVILDLKPGTRVVSHAFDMGEWKPDRTETVEGKTAYLWIVPAKVAGAWQLPQGELTLRQNFQAVEGTLKLGERVTPIANGRLRGDRLSFRAGGAEYSGKVGGNSIEGSVKSGGNQSKWSATRRADSPASAPKSP